MRKALLIIMAAVAAVCMTLGITSLSVGGVKANAETVAGVSPTFSSTKFLKSKDGDIMLAATGINNYSDCYECGYIVEGLDAVTYDTSVFYTSITTKSGQSSWTVEELFPSYKGMIVWELRANSFATSVKPYAKVGERINGVLYPKAKEEIAYGIEKEVEFTSLKASSSFGYSSDDDADFVCENFAQSGKALTFRYKPVGDRLSGESDDVTFSLQSGWNRVTAYITVDITNNNVRSNDVYIGMVEDVGDGWYKVTVNFS